MDNTQTFRHLLPCIMHRKQSVVYPRITHVFIDITLNNPYISRLNLGSFIPFEALFWTVSIFMWFRRRLPPVS